MAADIITLGLALDSRPIVAGAKALDDLARSAKPAAANASALEKAVAAAGKELQRAAKDVTIFDGNVGGSTKAVERYTAAQTALDKATRAAAAGHTALDKAAKGGADSINTVAKSGNLARHELINLSRQAQDIGVSLAGGMSPLTVLAQQGSQIFDIFSSSKSATLGGAFKQIGGGIASVLTPARLLGLGLGAVAIGGYAVYSSLSQSARAADDLAKSAGTTISAVRGFQTLASFKGIGAEESAKAFSDLARNVYDAKNGMGGLAEVMRANNMQARDFNGHLDNASTLIRRAAGNTQLQFSLLQQMGLPATQKWVDLLEQGGEALRKAINGNGTNDSVESKLAESARKFDEALRKATTNTSNYIKSWALSAYSALDNLIDRAVAGAGSFNRALGGVAEPAREPARVVITQPGRGASPPVDPAVAARALSLESQRLGILGELLSVNEKVRQQEIAIAQARAAGANISKADSQRILDNARANALGLTQMRAGIDAYNIETSTLGMATGAAVAYAAAQERILEAKRKGVSLSTLDIASINATASALGEAAQRSENMRAGYSALTNAGQTFASSLQQGATAMDALKSASVSALNSISSKLMQMATDRLWSSAFGGTSGVGSIFSGLGSLFGGGGAAATMGASGLAAIHHKGYAPGDVAPMRSVDPRLFINAPRFHSGIGPGEKAAIIRTDESVLTPGQMRAMGNGAGGGMTVTIPINIDATGADPAGLSRVENQIAMLKAELPDRVVAAVTKAKQQRKLA